jgi:hypothetical protein
VVDHDIGVSPMGEKDAKASCDTQAAEKKLSGAAKDSFTKKCVKDAVGT